MNNIETLNKIIEMMPDSPTELKDSIGFNQHCVDLWVESKVETMNDGLSVLDVGAGLCPYKKLFDHCLYWSQDFKQYGNIQIVSDITDNLPFSNEIFDVVLCAGVLEHVVDPMSAVKEMSRVLKIGGRLLIHAPFSCGSHQEPHIYYSGFHPNWYKHFMPKFGLEITELIPNGGFYKFVAQEVGRVSTKLAEGSEPLAKFNNESMIYLFKTLVPNFLLHFEKLSCDQLFSVGYFVDSIKVKHVNDS